MEIDGITHDRAPGEGAVTRCRIAFLLTEPVWRGWRKGAIRDERAIVDCMTCLVRQARFTR